MQTRLITVATEPRFYYEDFLSSARKYVGEPVIIGAGKQIPREEPNGNLIKSNRRLKLEWVADWLNDHVREQTHVLFVDAWDCIFQKPLSDIETVYNNYGHKFLAASEAWAWPLPAYAFPSVPTKYYSLNSGVWMAESEHALKVIDEMLFQFEDDYNDDQGVMQRGYVDGDYGIGIDFKNELVHTVLPGPDYEKSPFDLTLDFISGKVLCGSTNTYPCIVHCNGLSSTAHKARMQPVANKIFSFLRPHSSVAEHALDKREVGGANPSAGTNFKVFGIGLSRTGTTSLNEALKTLGIQAVHFPISHQQVAASRAATDTPVAVGYAYLDAMYHGSKFVLTVRRDIDAWLNSCERYWAAHLQAQDAFHQRIHRALYDTTQFDREKFWQAYHRHESEILHYFEGRPDDLLIMDIATGDGWSKLCPFLGVPEPDVPFPHCNKSILPR